jgi:FkbM family methyltransferase
MQFQLYKALKNLKAEGIPFILYHYAMGSKGMRSFKFTSPFTGKKFSALWQNNQDLREIISAFINNKWQQFKIADPKVIVDLGSNNGYSALYLKDRFANSQVYLVDLLQSNVLFSSSLFRKNTIDSSHLSVAVAGTNGMTMIDIHPAHSRNRMSSLLDDRQRKKFGFSEQRMIVPTRRLRTLLNDLNIQRVDLLKVDIEGAEQYLVEDVADWAPIVDTIILEVHHNVDPEWCEKQLRDAGYDVDRSQVDWLVTKESTR